MLKSIILVLVVSLTLVFSLPAFAQEGIDGSKIFQANCIGCHLRGNNTVVKSKTLKIAALQEYGMDSLEAIMTQVTKGKNAMPAFGKKLKAPEIQAVAQYVLDKAAVDWKK
jgi:cytochrome c6